MVNTSIHQHNPEGMLWRFLQSAWPMHGAAQAKQLLVELEQQLKLRAEQCNARKPPAKAANASGPDKPA